MHALEQLEVGVSAVIHSVEVHATDSGVIGRVA